MLTKKLIQTKYFIFALKKVSLENNPEFIKQQDSIKKYRQIRDCIKINYDLLSDLSYHDNTPMLYQNCTKLIMFLTLK